MMTSAKFSTSMEAQQAALLLEGYHFELGRHDARQWVSLWLESYRASWIRDAVVEALYQGRYKSISVKQILELWQRRGQPIRHATHDFEAAVCREFGEVRLAPIPPEKLPKKKHRSIARPNALQAQNNAQALSSAERNSAHSNATGPTPNVRSSRLQYRPNAAVSFNLSSLPPASPGMTARGAAVMTQQAQTSTTEPSATRAHTAAPSNENDSNKAQPDIRDNRDWREFPGYTTPTYSASSSDEVLRAQRQFNGVLYSSARAIQPFKPALPFSAQTLRLAKQKAIGLMHAAQQDIENERQMADIRR